MFRELEREGCVTAFVFAKVVVIDPDSRSCRRTLEVDEDALAARGARQLEMTSIGRDKLILLVVERVPGEHSVGVRNDHMCEGFIVELPLVIALDYLGAEAPAAIRRQHAKILSLDHTRLPFRKRERVRHERCSGRKG